MNRHFRVKIAFLPENDLLRLFFRVCFGKDTGLDRRKLIERWSMLEIKNQYKGFTNLAPLEGFEIGRVNSELTQTEFVLRGRRFHLFLLQKGSGTLIGEDGEHQITGPAACWLPNGMQRSVNLDAGSTALIINIPDATLGRVIPEDILGNQMRQIIGHWHHFYNVAREPFLTVLQQAHLMERELRANGPGMELVLQSSVSIVLVELWRLSGAEIIKPLPLPRNLVHEFLSLLGVHMRDHWSVAEYARQMGISRDRLTAILRRASGETPLALIHKKLIAEAKTLLVSSSQQVAEVAFSLGFNDPAYFNRFFQRHVGVTPSKYRKEKGKPDQTGDESFAAWP